MRKLPTGRLLAMIPVLAVGFVLGGTFATAGGGRSPGIDLESSDVVIDELGTVVVVDGEGYVEFPLDERATKTRVAVNAWNTLVKRRIVTEGSTVRVNGASAHGKQLEYRGHVTVLK